MTLDERLDAISLEPVIDGGAVKLSENDIKQIKLVFSAANYIEVNARTSEFIAWAKEITQQEKASLPLEQL